MMHYPIGVQDFETIRKSGYVYVDKTELIYRLTRGHIYFLGRPRRFGKSLLVSTLKYYFEGRRDLFEGLKMVELEQEWKKHPVLLFDFNLSEHKSPNGLRNYILDVIGKGEQEYDIAPLMEPDGKGPVLYPPRRLAHLLEEVHKKTGSARVVPTASWRRPDRCTSSSSSSTVPLRRPCSKSRTGAMPLPTPPISAVCSSLVPRSAARPAPWRNGCRKSLHKNYSYGIRARASATLSTPSCRGPLTIPLSMKGMSAFTVTFIFEVLASMGSI